MNCCTIDWFCPWPEAALQVRIVIVPNSPRRDFSVFSFASINDLYLFAFVFQSVALRFLSEIQDESITEDALKSIVRMCQYMHSSVIDASDLFLKVSRGRKDRTEGKTRKFFVVVSLALLVVALLLAPNYTPQTMFKVSTLIDISLKHD